MSVFTGSVQIVAGALCFLPFPNAPAMTKNILYVAGYVFWDAFYTVANVPYGSMLPLITDDTAERAQLSSWRSAGAMIASLPLGIMMPMFIYDSSNRVNGQSIWAVALVMGVLGFVAFQFLIRTTVIRVDVDARCGEDAPKFNILVAVKNFCKNRPAIGATMGSCAMYIAMAGASAAVSVMFQAYFKNAQISGLMALVTTLPMFLFMPFIGKIVRRFGMREAATFGAMFSVLACVLMLLLPITPDGKGMLMYVACQLLNGAGPGSEHGGRQQDAVSGGLDVSGRGDCAADRHQADTEQFGTGPDAHGAERQKTVRKNQRKSHPIRCLEFPGQRIETCGETPSGAFSQVYVVCP